MHVGKLLPAQGHLVNALPTATVGADLDLAQLEPLDVAVSHEEVSPGWFALGAGRVVCRWDVFPAGLCVPVAHSQLATAIRSEALYPVNQGWNL